MISRLSPRKRGNLWTVHPKQRVCSIHFVDGEPTSKNPLPTLRMGYHSSPRAKKVSYSSTRRSLNYSKSNECSSSTSTVAATPVVDNLPFVSPLSSPLSLELTSTPLLPAMEVSPIIPVISETEEMIKMKMEMESLKEKNILLQQENRKQKQLYNKLLATRAIEKKVLGNCIAQQNKQIKKQTEKIKQCKCETPYNKKVLISDKKCEFYTGIQTLAMFDKLHKIVSPYVKKRWRGIKLTELTSKKSTMRFGPERKLPSRDEFLLTLMKLRLGLLTEDLANRFKISIGLTSSIFLTWVKACSLVLAPLIFMPEQEFVSNTRPSRFKGMPDLHSIIDGTEFFIQTPKNPEMQKLTWSEYKHHNTLKALVCVSPNSMITFISKAYGGSISDKEITNKSGFLDFVPPYSQIMYDKGFNLGEECASRFITVSVPPGRRGSAQMTPAEIVKTKKIANMRILVEQVIRRLKIFRILSCEMALSLVTSFDEILIVCGALTNLRKPIFSD